MDNYHSYLPSSRAEYAIGGFAVLPVVIAVVAEFVPTFAIWLDDWSQALTGYFSLALSVALVYLYYQQKEVLESQNEPLVSTEGLYPREENHLAHFRAKISNIGGGPVTHLSLKVEPQIMSRGTVKSAFPWAEPETKEFVRSGPIYSNSTILDRAQSGEKDITLFNSRLESGETSLFHCPATLLLQHPEMDPGNRREDATNYAWGSAIDTLESLGVEDLRLKIWVEYQGLDTEGQELVSDFVISIDGDSSIKEHFEAGEPFHRYQLGPNTLHSKLD